MFHRRGRRFTIALTIALVGVLAASAVALAAGGVPTLIKPGKRVHRGHIRLVVKDTSALARKYHVFVTINRHKQLDKSHHLANCKKVDKGCYFAELKKYKGHPGEWTWVSPFSFPGYWATTPGKYFWQAQHVSSSGGLVVSKIKSFRVT